MQRAVVSDIDDNLPRHRSDVFGSPVHLDTVPEKIGYATDSVFPVPFRPGGEYRVTG